MRRTKSLPLALWLTAMAHTAHATEDAPLIPCVQRDGLPLVECAIRVRRDGDDTIVTAIFPNGFKRMLTFTDDRFVKGNPTMSGVGTDTDWSLEDGIHQIRVDDQRFEIPQALLHTPSE